jgi:aminopeptidase N
MLSIKTFLKILLTTAFAGFWSIGIYAQLALPNFLNAEIELWPDPFNETIKGEVRYHFEAPEGSDSLVINAHNMEFERVMLNGEPVNYRASDGKLSIGGLERQGLHELQIAYTAFPKQTVYFIGWKDNVVDNEQIWTQGQGKDSSHWVPVVDDMLEKVVFDLTIHFDGAYQVISNGALILTVPEGGLKKWVFDMEQPMSSYLLAFAIGKYDQQIRKSASGVPLELYYPQGSENKAHWTYLYTEEIFDFLEAEIGIPYPWKVYKQVPVSDFLYAGMENTGATLFSDRYLVDSLGYNDENYININAHELAHQWFGNLVTEKNATHHWLHEGFATHYAYRAEATLFGPGHIYWKLYETAKVLEGLDQKGQGEALLDPAAGSLTFYEKGAWALFVLRDQLGEEVFDRGIQLYLKNNAFSNATVADFLQAMEVVSGTSLSEFQRTWLESKVFPIATALEYLTLKDPEVGRFISDSNEIRKRILPDESAFQAYWQGGSSVEYKAHLIAALGPLIPRTLWEEAAQEKDLLIQKALLETTGETKAWMEPYFKTWLDAPSYVVRENVLFKLWVADPENRAAYLDQIAGNDSFESLRLKQLWWLLALLTPDYKTQELQQTYLAALRRTTGPGYSWEIRQNAMAMLQQVDALNLQNVRDIMEATEHHSWQFRKFSRAMLEDMFTQSPEEVDWKELAREFPKEKYKYLHDLIDNL